MTLEEELVKTDYLIKVFMKEHPEVIKDDFAVVFESWLESKAEEYGTEGIDELYQVMIKNEK